MPGYSDRIAHALAFTAKHAQHRGGGSSTLVRAASTAIILSRYECDEPTIVAGILHLALLDSGGQERVALERKIREKFGPIVMAVIGDVIEPPAPPLAKERAWEACRREQLGRLAASEPRALDICAASEIHLCGTLLADLRRLGVEYFPTISPVPARQALWWYRALFDALSGHEAWPRRAMLDELNSLRRELEQELAPEG
ncbi:MAG TPA: HD domain-containing protein [Gemmatimonadales bacterium]|nr:HD domain-containing protein [Gemmatimonadales bacterium]